MHPATTEGYEVLATWLPDQAATLRWAGPRVTFPFHASGLERQLQVAGSKSYALRRQSETLAFGQHWVTAPSSVHLGRLIVAPGHRGKGLGRELYQHLMAAGKAASGARSVTLRVYRDNTMVLALYLSLGFQVEAEERDGQVLAMRLNDA